ncbi:DUF885 domain-containing protein [Arenicella sp. 4NH20-0111]|uniref:DUF885 domain-containing protein n=1 Tax=Arenicella sp. 4NH20-0111 TaxID=3127648 RepID=UPI003108E1DC
MKRLNFLPLSIKLVLLVTALCSTTLLANETTSAEQKFNQILEDHWNSLLSENPTFATSLGVRNFDSLLPDPSLAAYNASTQKAKEFLTRLNNIDTSRLSAENQLNHDLLTLDLQNQVEASKHGGRYMIITNRGGPHLTLTSMVGRLPFFTKSDFLSYVNRLSKMPEYLEKATTRVRQGLNAGWVQPCEPMLGYEKSIETHLVDDVNESRFMQPFASKPTVISESDFATLRETAKTQVEQSVIPALRKFHRFYLESYKPNCNSKVDTSSLPGGADYYEHRVKFFTTTEQSADDVHKVGLSEVARIRKEMDEVIVQSGFKGDFKAWLEYLKTNPEFYPKSGEERMQIAATISKKMDGELPKLFGKLPRMPYGLKEIPLDIAEKTTTAYYQRPAGDGSRAGFYFVNTTLLDTRPIYQLEALSLHEAVPGHHLQIALSQELDLPNFRKYGGQTVFVEGWGLYSERLGLEVGFYQTPYTNFGRLSYEMWRACRLVVDTGLHSKGWTRQQAIDYMAENSGLSMNNVVSEVDRYITWPGQALAYKTGELKIRELRARAEKTLGNNFDVREFHDKILENGALPLSVLEDVFEQWLATKS